MQNKKDKNYEPGKASKERFGEFVRFISGKVIKKFGKSYDSADEIRSKWRTKYEYTPEIEEYLIRKAKFFIETFDSKVASTYDLGFLHAVLNEIADYLSLYTMRKRNGMSRKEARTELQKALWTENPHINYLRSSQSNKRLMRRSPKYEAQKRREDRQNKAKYDYEITQQVKLIFIETSTYRKK